MTDIFLSYSREDQPTARRFAEAFQHEGLSVWWDQALSPGETFDEVTEKALEGAGAVVVLWSNNAVASRWVRAEAMTADTLGTLVPVQIEPCKLPLKFGLTQTADLSGWNGDTSDPRWQAFLPAVRRLSGKAPAVKAASAPPAQTETSPASRPRRAVLAAAATVLMLGGIAAAYFLRRDAVPASAQPTANSIAVLPFVNISSDPEQEYFSDGLSEELLNELANVPDLRVIGRTSSFAFKGSKESLRSISETLGVNHILAGSVRKSGNRVRINAQLINPVDGSNLWSETYERTLEDIFAIQEEIATSVARELSLRMANRTVATGTRNIAAYDEYLIGRSYLNRIDFSMVEAVPHLEKALELDPDFLAARLWLIDAYTRQVIVDKVNRKSIIQRQDDAINQVLARAPGTPEASFALSYRVARGPDLLELERLLTRSLELSGSQGIRAKFRHAQFLLAVGRTADSVRGMEAVTRDDPLDVFTRVNLLLALELSGESAKVEAEAETIRQLPKGGGSEVLLGTAISRALSRGDATQIRRAVEAASASTNELGSGDLNRQLTRWLDDPAAGRRELRQAHDRLAPDASDFVDSAFRQWAAWYGDTEFALDLLERMPARELAMETWVFELWRPVMKDVRKDPRAKQVMRRIGLVDYWKSTGNWGDFCKPVGTDDFECR